MAGARIRRLVVPRDASGQPPEPGKRITVDELRALLAEATDGAERSRVWAVFADGRRFVTNEPAELLTVDEPHRLRALELEVGYPDGSSLHLELERWVIWASGPGKAARRARTVEALYRSLPARRTGPRLAMAAVLSVLLAVPVLLWMLLTDVLPITGRAELTLDATLIAGIVAGCLIGWLAARAARRWSPERTGVLPPLPYHRRRPEVIGFVVVGAVFTAVVVAVVVAVAE